MMSLQEFRERLAYYENKKVVTIGAPHGTHLGESKGIYRGRMNQEEIEELSNELTLDLNGSHAIRSKSWIQHLLVNEFNDRKMNKTKSEEEIVESIYKSIVRQIKKHL